MSRYLIRRLLLAGPVVLGVSILIFVAMNVLPGDTIQAMVAGAGEGGTLSREAMENMRLQLGLNDPLYVRYLRFITKAIHGDLGISLYSGRSVLVDLWDLFPNTLQLAVAGMTVAVGMGVTLGIIAALKHNTWLDNAAMVLALLFVSMPQFWFGLVLILIFVLQLGWFPLTGQGGAEYLVLPAVTLGVRSAAILARLTRSSLLEVLGEDYVRTARAKGLRNLIIIARHALKNALVPVVTVVGLQFGGLLAGSVVIEMVFARRGVGQIVIKAIMLRDYPMVQGAVLFMSVFYILINLLVDVLYAYLNPRIRYA